MDGVLITDKPAGVTSHDVVNRVRRIFKTKRVGHTGTLDPFATGVLVILIGKATRLAQFVDKAAKEYVAEVRFGSSTDTGDLTGQPIGDKVKPRFSITDLESALNKFRGEIVQIPPMHSAKKVDGKKLYELARKGQQIERKPLVANIYELELLGADLESDDGTKKIRVVCSAGTYIRTLAEDLGKELGVGAHLTALRRTAAGDFRVENAIELEELMQSDAPASWPLPIETLVSHLRRFEIPRHRVDATINGLSTQISENHPDGVGDIAMFTPDSRLIAIGTYNAAESSIKPNIVLG